MCTMVHMRSYNQGGPILCATSVCIRVITGRVDPHCIPWCMPAITGRDEGYRRWVSYRNER